MYVLNIDRRWQIAQHRNYSSVLSHHHGVRQPVSLQFLMVTLLASLSLSLPPSFPLSPSLSLLLFNFPCSSLFLFHWILIFLSLFPGTYILLTVHISLCNIISFGFISNLYIEDSYVFISSQNTLWAMLNYLSNVFTKMPFRHCKLNESETKFIFPMSCFRF